MIKDPTIFSDIADALNIKETAFVEKDYYAVQLLKRLNELVISDYKIIFSGGTCLSKAYQNTQRISEDLDIKFVARKSDRKKAHRKKLSQLIIDEIEASDVFEMGTEPIYADVYRAQNFEIQYPKRFSHPALKSVLKLELVESMLYEPTHKFPVSSLYAEVMKMSVEIVSMECVNMESIIVEKLIALLWRTSAHALGGLIKNDPALVRHLYDIHTLLSSKKGLIDLELLREISVKSLQDHAIRYRNKHPEFNRDPKRVLSHGFEEIQTNVLHKERYEQLLLPLIYAQNPPGWDEVLESFGELYKGLYGPELMLQ